MSFVYVWTEHKERHSVMVIIIEEAHGRKIYFIIVNMRRYYNVNSSAISFIIVYTKLLQKKRSLSFPNIQRWYSRVRKSWPEEQPKQLMFSEILSFHWYLQWVNIFHRVTWEQGALACKWFF